MIGFSRAAVSSPQRTFDTEARCEKTGDEHEEACDEDRARTYMLVLPDDDPQVDHGHHDGDAGRDGRRR